jgi:hypothetical protein
MSYRSWTAVVLSVVSMTTACSSDRASDVADDAAQSRATSTTAVATTTTEVARPSDQFCELASRAVAGNSDFTSDAQVAVLAGDSSLTEQQKRRVEAAAADARRQIVSGTGYANDLLVAVVNEICGTNFTAVTMIE